MADGNTVQADHGEAINAHRARFLRLLGIFKGLILGFWILFVLIAVGAFGISLYLYFAPESTVFGVVLHIAPVPSLAMLVTGSLMWVLVRVVFRRIDSILKVGDGPESG